MTAWAYHQYDGKVESLSTAMLLRRWSSTLSRAPSSPILKQCEISVRRSGSLRRRLILTVECELPIISEAQILEGCRRVCRNLGLELTSKTSNPSSEQSSSPTPE